jgi:hypothetical protein
MGFTWTPGQVLTAAEMTTVTDLLPYPTVTTVSVNPGVAGAFYRCQPTGGGTITITLPAPTAGILVGAKLDAAASAGNVVVQRNSADVIYLPYTASRGVTSVTLTRPDAPLILVADGTNWHAVSGVEPPAEGYYEQAGGAASGITSEVDTATLVLSAQGYAYRAKIFWEVYVSSSDTTSTFKARVRRDTPLTGTELRNSIGPMGGGSIPVCVCHVDVSPDASLTVCGSVQRNSGSGTGQTFADITSHLLTVTTVPL